MELSKKTTILFSPGQHKRLTKIAKLRHSSVGELVRSACDQVYRDSSMEEKLEAVRRLSLLNGPVSDVATMKRESIKYKEQPLP